MFKVEIWDRAYYASKLSIHNLTSSTNSKKEEKNVRKIRQDLISEGELIFVTGY